FAATASVRDRVNDAAIEQTETIGGEIDRHGYAVAPITIKEKRCGAVERSRTPSDERDRDLGAVGGGGVEAPADVERWIVAAEDGLLFAQNGFACSDVIVENGTRCDEGLVLVTKVSLVEFRICADGSVVSGFGELDAMRSIEHSGARLI